MTANRAPTLLTPALCGAYFLVLLDVTVVNVALPRIALDLAADSAALAWIVDAYALPLASLLLVSGAIGDHVGHRRVVLAGMVCFWAASAACACAPTVAWLIAARAVQGIGAALMLPGTLALLVGTIRDERARNRLVGTWAAVGGAALPAGPLIGGLLVEAAGWRSVFWLSVPLIAAAINPVLRLPREPHASGAARVDRAGAVALTVCLVAFVAAIIETPGSIVAGGVLAGVAISALVAFVRIERHAPQPLLRVPPSGRGMLALAALVAGLMNLCALGVLFVLTRVFQDVHLLGPLGAGLLTLPAMLPLPLLARPSAALASRIGVWWTCAIGAALAAAGLAFVAATSADVTNGLGPLVVALALWGTGPGVLTPAVVAAALRAVPEAPGLASGVSNTARQTGGALGVALFSAVAGGVDDPGFAMRCAYLLAGAACVFAVSAGLCAFAARSRGRQG